MSEHPERFDQPEPDDALHDAAADSPDHDATDADDRDVELHEPTATVPPVDDEDRAPDRPGYDER
jgi:hypothetical protein